MAASNRERSKKFRDNKSNNEGKKEIRNQWVKFENFEEVKKWLSEKIEKVDGGKE